ncbi:MAG: hypothetical protein ACOCPM_06660 [Bacteroidales bacterium]
MNCRGFRSPTACPDLSGSHHFIHSFVKELAMPKHRVKREHNWNLHLHKNHYSAIRIADKRHLYHIIPRAIKSFIISRQSSPNEATVFFKEG